MTPCTEHLGETTILRESVSSWRLRAYWPNCVTTPDAPLDAASASSPTFLKTSPAGTSRVSPKRSARLCISSTGSPVIRRDWARDWAILACTGLLDYRVELAALKVKLHLDVIKRAGCSCAGMLEQLISADLNRFLFGKNHIRRNQYE